MRMNEIKKLFSRYWAFMSLAIIAVLHILKIIRVDGYGILLIVLASLPITVPLFAKYLKSLKFGKDGFEAVVADNLGAIASTLQKDTTSEGAIYIANEKLPDFQYNHESLKILATLWYYQKMIFGEDSIRRWGFGVGIGATDYQDFCLGITPLSAAGLVSVDKRGICYLTNEGVVFCKKYRVTLDNYGPGYTNFGSLPN